MVLTSDTTSWDMSLWIAARQSWVIFGSLVPQPIRNGCTTSELFSFRAAETGQIKINVISHLQSGKSALIFTFFTKIYYEKLWDMMCGSRKATK